MARIDMFSFTNEELEEYLDAVKPVIVRALVRDGFMESEEADEWCKQHTVLLRKKSFFRTLTDKWKKDEEAEGSYIIVVKRT